MAGAGRKKMPPRADAARWVKALGGYGADNDRLTEARRRLRLFEKGLADVQGVMPGLRALTAAILRDPDVRLSPQRRLTLLDFATMYGTVVRNARSSTDDPKIIQRTLSFTASQWANIQTAAKRLGQDPNRWAELAAAAAAETAVGEGASHYGDDD